MPFDETTERNTERAHLWRLVGILRDRGRWPARFRWDYRYRSRCAWGLAEHFGIDHCAGLTGLEHSAVFLWCRRPFLFSYRWTRPIDVARKLERVLMRYEGKTLSSADLVAYARRP